MSETFVGVENGMIVVSDSKDREHKFKHTEIDKLRAYFREHKVSNVMCSSSCDFPEEDGLPNVNVRKILAETLWEPNELEYPVAPRKYDANTPVGGIRPRVWAEMYGHTNAIDAAMFSGDPAEHKDIWEFYNYFVQRWAMKLAETKARAMKATDD